MSRPAAPPPRGVEEDGARDHRDKAGPKRAKAEQLGVTILPRGDSWNWWERFCRHRRLVHRWSCEVIAAGRRGIEPAGNGMARSRLSGLPTGRRQEQTTENAMRRTVSNR